MPGNAIANGIPFVSNKSHEGAWTPAKITTSLWLDASDSSTITESVGKVSQWRDKSGNARHADQSQGAAQPSTGSTINSVSALNFLGNSIRMESSSASYLSGAYTLYVVAELASTPVSNNHYIGTNNAVLDQGLHVGWSSNTTFKHGHYADDKEYLATQTADPKIHTNIFKDGGSELRINNSLIGTSGFPNNALSTSSDLLIGTGYVLSQNWDGTIGEMILLAREASVEDDTNIYNYLSTKWAIS